MQSLPASGSSTKVSSPQEVGWLFVPQYYTFVNKDPSRLHCFYTKRSTFVHGTEGEEINPRYGQQEIHERILALGFEDCKVYVSNVDSQSSADGGIIVQVLGEMSNRGGEWRKFAQTFFLAEQPNGYFVLNDIFRYIKEESDDRDDLPAPASPAVPESLPPVVQPINDSYAATSARQESTSIEQMSTQMLPELDANVRFDSEGTGTSPQVVQHQVNGWHHDAEPSVTAAEQTIPTSPVAEAVSEPAPSTQQTETHTSLPEPVISSIPHDVAPTATSSSAVSTSEAVDHVSQPAAEAPVTAPAPIKKTWASLAASSGAWKSAAPAVPRGVSANASTPGSTAPALKPPTASTSTAQPPPAVSSSGRAIPNVANLTHANCFVKNVQEQVTDDGLRRTLEDAFGPIKELDIVRSKACAFLEFKSIESAKRAIHFCSPHSNGGHGGIECDGMFIHIEEKKPKGDATRLSGQPRGGGRAGAGATGTSRGGATSGAQPMRSSTGATTRPGGPSVAANTMAGQNRAKQK